MGSSHHEGRGRPGLQACNRAVARGCAGRLSTIAIGTVLLVALTCLLVAAGPAKAATDGPPAAQTDHVVIYDRGPYYEVHLDVAGAPSSYELGYEYGTAVIKADRLWETKCWTYVNAAALEIVSYGDLVARASAIKQQLPSDQRAMIEGMAAGIKANGIGLITEEKCYILNLFPDICRPTQCSALGAWGSRTAGGKPIVGRVLDWSDDPLLPTMHALQVFHNGDKTFCSIGFLGLLEVISGFNPRGVYGAILDSPTGKPYPSPIGKRSYPFDLREALESGKDVASAASYLQPPRNYAFNHLILLADRTRVGVLENDLASTGTLARKVRTDTTPLNTGITWGFKDAVCAVNCFVAKGNDSSQYGTAWNTNRWAAYLAQMRTVGGKINASTMEDIISYGHWYSDDQPYNYQTVQSMVFQPSTGHLDIFFKRWWGLPRRPSFESIDINFGGNASFAGRWQRTWQPAGWTATDARVVKAPNGDACVAVQLQQGEQEAVGLVRYRADGRARWRRVIRGADGRDLDLAGVSAGPDVVVVGGTASDAAGQDWQIQAYSPKGKSVGRWPGDSSAPDGALGGLVCDDEGNVYAGGDVATVEGAAASSDWCLRKITTKGRLRWERTLAAGTPGAGESITDVSRLGTSTVVGGSWDAGGAAGGLAVARFGDTGTRRWMTTWDDDSYLQPAVTGLEATQQGIAVGGIDQATQGSRRIAFKLEPAAGASAWSFTDPPDSAGSSRSFTDVGIDLWGQVTAVGATKALTGSEQLGLISFFSPGGTEAAVDFGSAGSLSQATAIVTTPESQSFVTGAMPLGETGRQAMFVSCWMPEPRQEWHITYASNAAASIGYDLALAADSVFVAGSRDGALLLARYPVDPIEADERID